MWTCAGVRWREDGPEWMWWHPEQGVRATPLRLGEDLRMAVAEGTVRRCAGVWRSGRRTPCPYAAQLPPKARRDQCECCSALDRTSSVAADTRADDPRPYAVYLAYFGPGLHKVGITAVARGRLRLLEQAAVCFTFLGEGPLMTARRTEAVLGAALRIPDRVSATAKRAARHHLAAPDRREAEVAGLYAEVTALQDRLPQSLRLRPYRLVDHAALFGLTGPATPGDPGAPGRPDDRGGPVAEPPTAEVTALQAGCALTGTVRAVAGHDLHLDTPAGRLLLDARLTAGWPLQRPPAEGAFAVPTAPLRRAADVPQPLF